MSIREFCSECDSSMHRVCAGCGKAFCRRHIVSSEGHCLHCAARCSHPGCGLIATKNCQRCRRMLCVTHRSRGDVRCAHCEQAFDTAVANKLARLRSGETGVLGAVVLLGAGIASLFFLHDQYSQIALLGIAGSWTLGQFSDALGGPPEGGERDLRRHARAQFLRERLGSKQ